MRFALLSTLLCLLLCPLAAAAGSPCGPAVLSAATVRENTPGFSVDAQYPVLCAPKARRMVRDRVSSEIASFKMADPEHDLSFFPHQYALDIRYAAWVAADGRLASVKLNVSAYTGGAHPNHWPVTWVFDLEQDRPIPLSGLFADTATALPEVAAMVREPLRRSLGDMFVPEMMEYGLQPTEENFSRFVLTGEGAAFFFAPYQVGPYAAGEQVVTVPYADLAPLLAPAARELLNIPARVAP
ncbi:MAG: DUF3298 domain-containing protein [Desulfovibrionaceae bacterium]|nr:DUF3298 domain-containing protein [Desulfovibrionaceae bacterium]